MRWWLDAPRVAHAAGRKDDLRAVRVRVDRLATPPVVAETRSPSKPDRVDALRQHQRGPRRQGNAPSSHCMEYARGLIRQRAVHVDREAVVPRAPGPRSLISRRKYSISWVRPTAKEGITTLPPRSSVLLDHRASCADRSPGRCAVRRGRRRWIRSPHSRHSSTVCGSFRMGLVRVARYRQRRRSSSGHLPPVSHTSMAAEPSRWPTSVKRTLHPLVHLISVCRSRTGAGRADGPQRVVQRRTRGSTAGSPGAAWPCGSCHSASNIWMCGAVAQHDVAADLHVAVRGKDTALETVLHRAWAACPSGRHGHASETPLRSDWAAPAAERFQRH